MDSDSDQGDYSTYAQVERDFNSLEGPSAQERMDFIVPFLVSVLPAPYVPAPEVESDSDDDRFSLTSSDDEPDDGDALALALAAAPGDGEDRISRLPDTLLADIIHRLPTKDAGRTAALSTHWRRVWAGTPLLVDDAHLLGAGGTNDVPVVRALARCVAAHPGPIRGARVTGVSFYAHEYALQGLVADLADKGVRDLILVNRPWPLDVPLPATLLGITTLTSLYLGLWKFPDTSALRSTQSGAGALFPHLRELVLYSVVAESRDMDFLLAGSPVLEKFGIVGSRDKTMRLRLVGQQLQCAQILMSAVDSVAVVDTPNLERFILWGAMAYNSSCIRLKIGKAPKLRVLGYLSPGIHMLEIRNTVINAGIKATPSTMVPGIKILGLNVRFGVRNDSKMLPTFLRCFPNVETLHIVSQKTDEVAGKINLKFWQEAGPIESIRSSIKMMTFHEFRMERSEVAFLKFFFQSAHVLKNAVLVVSNGSFAFIPEVINKLKTLILENGASNSCCVTVYESSDPAGGGALSLQKGFDFSVSDPLMYR